MLFHFRHPMTFLQRLGNTLATYLIQWARDYLMMNRLEDVIDFQFPGKKAFTC